MVVVGVIVIGVAIIVSIFLGMFVDVFVVGVIVIVVAIIVDMLVVKVMLIVAGVIPPRPLIVLSENNLTNIIVPAICVHPRVAAIIVVVVVVVGFVHLQNLGEQGRCQLAAFQNAFPKVWDPSQRVGLAGRVQEDERLQLFWDCCVIAVS